MTATALSQRPLLLCLQVLEMLTKMLMLEYVNGSSSSAADSKGKLARIMQQKAPWYAVNPLLRERPEFIAALEAQERRDP